jgi:signal transduction histidine kinase
VLQTLAGIGCQLDACSQSTQSGGEENIYIKTASRMVQGGQEDLRNIVSALHCLPSLDQTFGESVRGVVRRLQRTGATVRDASPTRNGEDVSRLGTPADGQPQIVVNCDPDLPKLADFIAGNLLLIIQEATRNAVKHAAANVVTITVKPFDNRSTVLISVVDDGRGFELRTRPRVSEGHFGLETMKGRAERIGGVLTIETKPGEGTRIVASAPLRSFDEAIT